MDLNKDEEYKQNYSNTLNIELINNGWIRLLII
jgi:hypothetical protein